MIAVIGLGNIGLAIGRRVVECGEDVVGIDLSPDRRDAWAQATGLKAADSLDAVNWDCVQHVLVVVRLTSQADAVLRQLDNRLADGATVLIMTTLELAFARGLGDYATRPWHLVEMPVSGGEGGALAGRLTVMTAGRLEPEAEALLRRTLATHVVRFKAFGEPTLAKLLNNVAAAYNARSFAEVVLLGRGAGLDATTLQEVLRTSSGGSWMADAFLHLVDDLLEKDVALLREQLGDLPEISLTADSGLAARLAEARALLDPEPAAGEAG